ncbi:MAG: Gfo/Idh/MocA family oxidoreductase [Kiritimatiellae bacterium]|jgi:predicted dehydrogenase|nr:Gfo/Idh/MocA family oxidoreductase [Kiritimatiellia bacterium]
MSKVKRRDFIKTITAGVGGISVLGAHGQNNAHSKKPLRIAVIGCGDRGVRTLLPESCKERVVALVDPDPRCIEKALGKVRKVAPSVDAASIKIYSDYRKMFDEMGKKIDAVMIAAPNHHHAPAALLAIRRGIHVYLEKPLTHTIQEARQLRDEAKKYGVVTQMGQHGHSNEGCRRLCEYIWAGAIGQVREVHCWTTRCNGLMSSHNSPRLPLPEGFDWDNWIGPAPFCSFHDDLHPHNWHLWKDFGNGSIGNQGCHILDASYWALKLKAPEAVELEDVYGGDEGVWPIRSRIRWDFPAREEMAPVKIYWYDGLAAGVEYSEGTVQKRWRSVNKRKWQNVPPLLDELEKKYNRNLGRNGSLLVGDKGVMVIGPYGDGCRILPEEAHRAFPVPNKILPRVKGTHQDDFFQACHNKTQACANFDYSAPLAEIALLGDLAMLAGPKRRLQWDSDAMRCTNMPELNQYLNPASRDGWTI